MKKIRFYVECILKFLRDLKQNEPTDKPYYEKNGYFDPLKIRLCDQESGIVFDIFLPDQTFRTKLKDLIPRFTNEGHIEQVKKDHATKTTGSTRLIFGAIPIDSSQVYFIARDASILEKEEHPLNAIS